MNIGTTFFIKGIPNFGVTNDKYDDNQMIKNDNQL